MLVGLGSLTVPTTVTASLVAVLRGRMLRLAERASRQAATEARPVAVSAALPDATVDRIGQLAQAAVDVIVSGYTSGAAREALRLSGPDVDTDTVAAAVEAHLTGLSEAKGSGWLHSNIAGAMTGAQSAGREAVLAQLPAGTSFRATEVNDANRCIPCRDVDGTVYDSLADALADYPTGIRYRACLGGGRCRGLIYPVRGED